MRMATIDVHFGSEQEFHLDYLVITTGEFIAQLIKIFLWSRHKILNLGMLSTCITLDTLATHFRQK